MFVVLESQRVLQFSAAQLAVQGRQQPDFGGDFGGNSNIQQQWSKKFLDLTVGVIRLLRVGLRFCMCSCW